MNGIFVRNISELWQDGLELFRFLCLTGEKRRSDSVSHKLFFISYEFSNFKLLTMQKPGGKRLVSSKSGLKIINQHDTEVSPFELSVNRIRILVVWSDIFQSSNLFWQEPQWQLDSEVQSCSKCDIKFTFLNRRHHCRRCGMIFCKNCTSEKVHGTNYVKFT